MQSDSMSDGQDISLQGAYRQDQGAKLEVKQTNAFRIAVWAGLIAYGAFKYWLHKKAEEGV